MKKRITIDRLGSPRIDEELVKRVLEIRAHGVTDEFWTSDQKGRRVRIQRRSSADLYQRVMAAKGLLVRVGEVA